MGSYSIRLLFTPHGDGRRWTYRVCREREWREAQAGGYTLNGKRVLLLALPGEYHVR